MLGLDLKFLFYSIVIVIILFDNRKIYGQELNIERLNPLRRIDELPQHPILINDFKSHFIEISYKSTIDNDSIQI